MEIPRTNIHPVQHGDGDTEEFCVFYEIEEGSQVFTNAFMYRLSEELLKPFEDPLPTLHPYVLRLPYPAEYMCECSCQVETANLLHGFVNQQGDELIIQDRCQDRTTRIFFYHWLPEDGRYKRLGYFDAYDIRFDPEKPNRVIVDYQSRPSAEWVYRCRYRPCTEIHPNEEIPVSFYDSICDIPHKECEFEFYGDMPSPGAIRNSPYPETILLGFYKNYSDWDIAGTFFADPTDAGFCAGGRCGCTSPPEDVTEVHVEDMVVNEHGCVDRDVCYEDHPESFLYDWTLIETQVRCEPDEDGTLQDSLTWLVARIEGGGWRLDGILDDSE
jgi:hypothetical protein